MPDARYSQGLSPAAWKPKLVLMWRILRGGEEEKSSLTGRKMNALNDIENDRNICRKQAIL
jgi:hypothetical protein